MYNFSSNTTEDECQSPMKKHNLNEIVSVVEVDTSDNSQTAANTVSTLIEGNNLY